MHRQTARTRTSASSAYTLIEVLLAMMILTILIGMAASPLMQSWRDQRTGSATENVRALLAGSRILALDQDQTWQFVYEPGGTRYLRIPQSAPEEQSGLEEQSADDSANRGKHSGTLPMQIRFGESSGGAASTITPEQLSGLSDATELSGVSWSSPILFFSDGTSSDAGLEILDEYGNARTISVRDLTGGVTVRQGTSL